MLYAFSFYQKSGGGPVGALSTDGRGNLYGTVAGGTKNGVGGVFRLSSRGNDTFSLDAGKGEGGNPLAGVIVDSERGALFGTNSDYHAGGPGNVFEITAPGIGTVLHTFCRQNSCADGAYPVASLLEDAAGNLYGTTEYGGSGTFCSHGCGVVFEIVQSPSKP